MLKCSAVRYFMNQKKGLPDIFFVSYMTAVKDAKYKILE
jgi:hypothetical protein